MREMKLTHPHLSTVLRRLLKQEREKVNKITRMRKISDAQRAMLATDQVAAVRALEACLRFATFMEEEIYRDE